MTRLWKALAIATLGVAAFQWLDLFKYIVGGYAFAVATGGRFQLLMTVDPWPLRMLLLWLVGVAVVAAISSRHLHDRSPSFARCGRAATILLLGNAAIWMGLVASPLVVRVFPFAECLR